VNLSLSFIRGMLAAVNPCGFVLLPTYLLYFLGLSNAEAGSRRAPLSRALLVSAAVSAGFMTVFIVIGSIAEFFTSWVIGNAKYLTGLIGLVFVGLGFAMLFGYRLPINTPKLDAGGRDRTVWSMFVYGIAYAVASIGCTLPLFLGVLFGTAERAGFAAGVANVIAYSLGMALLVTALTVTLAVANVGMLRVLRSSTQYVEMIAGAFVMLSGVYLLWYFWSVDIRKDGSQVTDTVDSWQSRFSGFLDAHWQVVAIVLAVIVGAAIAVVAAREVGRRRTPPVEPSSSDPVAVGGE
jgi:cytochrome c biogenesis protein CcdA